MPKAGNGEEIRQLWKSRCDPSEGWREGRLDGWKRLRCSEFLKEIQRGCWGILEPKSPLRGVPGLPGPGLCILDAGLISQGWALLEAQSLEILATVIWAHSLSEAETLSSSDTS